MKRTTGLKRKEPIRKVHPETKKNLMAYMIFRPYYLRMHPLCELILDCMRPAVDIHHVRGHGYRGRWLCDERWIKAACREHHRFIHDNMNDARSRGLIKKRL
jgi:hypothetical protein